MPGTHWRLAVAVPATDRQLTKLSTSGLGNRGHSAAELERPQPVEAGAKTRVQAKRATSLLGIVGG